jgi:hypothetical protein
MAARKNPGFNRHPVENVKLGLRVLAKVGGDAGRAAMILASDETIAHPPGRQTLNRWKIRYAQPYHQLFEEERASVDNWAADTAREIAIKAQAGSEQLVDRTIERIDEIEPKDLARSAYNLTQVSAEQVKTGRLLEEKPTQITEVRNPNEIIQELEALGVVKKREAITVDVLDEETPSPVEPPTDGPAT